MNIKQPADKVIKGKASNGWQRRGRPKIPAPPVPENPETILSKADALSFITGKVIEARQRKERSARRILPIDETVGENSFNAIWREERNKVSGRVETAIANGQLREINGGIVYGDLIAWALGDKKLQEVLGTNARFFSESSLGRGPKIDGEATSVFLPGNIEKCQDALSEAYARVRQLEDSEVVANVKRKK